MLLTRSFLTNAVLPVFLLYISLVLVGCCPGPKKYEVLEQEYIRTVSLIRIETAVVRARCKKLKNELAEIKKAKTALVKNRDSQTIDSENKIKKLEEKIESYTKQIEKLKVTEDFLKLTSRKYYGHVKFPESLFHFSRRYWRLQEYDKSRELYQYVTRNSSDIDLAIRAQAWVVRCEIKLGNESAVEKELNTLKNDYSQHEKLYSEIYSLCDEYWDKGDYVRAKALCQYVSENSPNSKLASRATGWVAICEIKLGNESATQQMIDAFWAKYSSTEDFADKVHIIAGTYRKQGLYKRSIELCQRLLDSVSDKKTQLFAHAGIVKSYLRSGDHIKAEELLDMICADFAGHEEFGRALFGVYDDYFVSAFPNSYREPGEKGLKVLQKCLPILQRITKVRPYDKYVGKALGWESICYLKMGDEANAAAAMDELIRNANDIPGFSHTAHLLSKHYFSAKNYERSKKLAIYAIEHSKDAEIAGKSAYRVALCARKLKDKATAIKYYRLIIEKYPKSRPASLAPNELGLLYCSQKNYEQAIYWFTKQRELYDDPLYGSRATSNLGGTYALLGDYAKAVEVFENYKQWYPSGTRNYYIPFHLATCYEKLGRKPEAIAVLNDALEKWPNIDIVSGYKKHLNRISMGEGE